MTRYEYKVVPAPTKGTKAKGVKTAPGRFANSVEAVLNAMGADGWEYLRAELLPSDERSGLTGTATNWRNLLVFRRAIASGDAALEPRVLGPAQTDGQDNSAEEEAAVPPVYARSGFRPAEEHDDSEPADTGIGAPEDELPPPADEDDPRP